MEQVTIYPKTRKELFDEYNERVSRSTFTKWCKELEAEGKIRVRKNLLTVKEVITFYEEFGRPGLNSIQA